MGRLYEKTDRKWLCRGLALEVKAMRVCYCIVLADVACGFAVAVYLESELLYSRMILPLPPILLTCFIKSALVFYTTRSSKCY